MKMTAGTRAEPILHSLNAAKAEAQHRAERGSIMYVYRLLGGRYWLTQRNPMELTDEEAALTFRVTQIFDGRGAAVPAGGLPADPSSEGRTP